jgi:hypothetical protein
MAEVRSNTLPKPVDILNLARKDAMVETHLQRWRRGELTWEHMLMHMVLAMHDRSQPTYDFVISDAIPFED